MMITKYNIMTECKESGIGKNNFKLALGTLLATVGITISGCGKNSSANADTPNASNTPPAKEMLLASADEAKDFATLSIAVLSDVSAYETDLSLG